MNSFLLGDFYSKLFLKNNKKIVDKDLQRPQ